MQNILSALVSALLTVQGPSAAWAGAAQAAVRKLEPCSTYLADSPALRIIREQAQVSFKDISSPDLIKAILALKNSNIADVYSLRASMREALRKRDLPSFQQVESVFDDGEIQDLIGRALVAPFPDATEMGLYVDWLLGVPTMKVAADERDQLNKGTHERDSTWWGLPAETLNTPYGVLENIVKFLNLTPGSKVVDMGSGFGRFGILIGMRHPGIQFLGYEYHLHRMQATADLALRLGWSNVRFAQADFAAESFQPEIADVYFTYFSSQSEEVMHKLFEKLLSVARQRPIRVVCRSFYPTTRWPDWVELNHAIVKQEVTVDATVVYTLDARSR